MAYGIGCLDFTNLTAPKRTSGLVRKAPPKGAIRRRVQDRKIIPVLVTHNGGATYKIVQVREGFVNGVKTAYCYAGVKKVEKLG